MRILVTGGSGFIGTALVRKLASAHHQVTIFDKRMSKAFPSETIVGDVRDSEAVISASKGVDAIVNLAAEHRDDVRPTKLYYDVNVGGAKNIVVAAEKSDIRAIVFTSSVAVYGLNQAGAAEDAKISPFNDYGSSKAQAEQVFNAWVAADPQRSLVTLRPAVVFGEGNRGNVFNLIDLVKKDRFLMVGDGSNRKSMAYLGNIIEFMVVSLEFGAGRYLFNFADKPDLTTNELIAIVYKRLGKSPPRFQLPYFVGLLGGYMFDLASKLSDRSFPISSVRIRKFCANTVVATSALQAFDYKPRYTINEGLDRMITRMLEDGSHEWVEGES